MYPSNFSENSLSAINIFDMGGGESDAETQNYFFGLRSNACNVV